MYILILVATILAVGAARRRGGGTTTGTGTGTAPTPVAAGGPASTATVDAQIRGCKSSGALATLTLTNRNPCGFTGVNIYLPGDDTVNTTNNILFSITSGWPDALHRRNIHGLRRGNLDAFCWSPPATKPTTPPQVCDEYPFSSTYENTTRMPHYRGVPAAEQTISPRGQGWQLKQFYLIDCRVSNDRTNAASVFGVVPQLRVPSFWICANGTIGPP